MRGGVGAAVVMIWLAVGTSPAWGQGFPGDGVLSGRMRLKVRSCGRATLPIDVEVAVQADGTWTAADPTSRLAGTGVIGGRGGRRLTLTLDANGTATVIERIEAEASALCGEAITPTAVGTRKAVLKVNRKVTRARLLLVHVGDGVGSDGVPRKTKYRLVAQGPWNGPLSCAEIVDCRASCVREGPACVEACVARGALATQSIVTPLFDCLDEACPTAELLCEDTALAGVCADELDACIGPPPPPADLTCEDIFDCRGACAPDDIGCPAACLERGTERGRSEATAVLECVATVCQSGDPGCVNAALTGVCADVWEVCTGTRPPRNLTCAQVLGCIGTCPAGNLACEADCVDRGSTAARAELDAVNACVGAACPTGDPRCIADSVSGQCASEWAACLF